MANHPDPLETIPAVIKTLIRENKIPTNPVTGRVELQDLMRYMDAHPDQQRELFSLVEAMNLDGDKADVTAYDYPSLAKSIVPRSFWVVQLEIMGFVDQAGTQLDPDQVHSVPGAKPTFVLYCYDDKEQHRNVQNIDNLPTSDGVLTFIQRAIAIPLPPLKPCLPSLLLISSKLQQHAEYLKPFLDSLPKPFGWRIETAEEAQQVAEGVDRMNQRGVQASLELAEKAKAAGNSAFKSNARYGAVKAYGDAIEHLVDVLSQKPKATEEKQAKHLLAVCFGNRAAAYLLPGPGLDAKKAMSDGEASIKSNPNYGKGYVRQARALQSLGDIERAKDVVAGALHLPTLENDQALTELLIELYTEAKGLSNDEASFKDWLLDITINDERSSMRLKGIKGAWSNRLDEKLQHWARLRASS